MANETGPAEWSKVKEQQFLRCPSFHKATSRFLNLCRNGNNVTCISQTLFSKFSLRA